MAEFVVDPLEAVDVHERHADRRAGPLAPRHLRFERLVERAPVAELGQGVRASQALSLLLLGPQAKR